MLVHVHEEHIRENVRSWCAHIIIPAHYLSFSWLGLEEYGFSVATPGRGGKGCFMRATTRVVLNNAFTAMKLQRKYTYIYIVICTPNTTTIYCAVASIRHYYISPVTPISLSLIFLAGVRGYSQSWLLLLSYSYFGQAWSSVRGSVGSCATSANIWVSSLERGGKVAQIYEVERYKKKLPSCGHLLDFMGDLIDIDAVVGGRLWIITVPTLER